MPRADALTPTLAVIAVIMLQQTLLAVLWLVMAALKLARRATLHWALATAAVAAGLVLVGQRDSLPVWAGFWLSNALALAGFMLVRRGVAVFARRPHADAEQIGFWCASMALLAWTLRHDHVAAVVGVIDADHFKAINDCHGHPAGDEVLRALARALHGVSRVTDLAARTGGEEFWLLMPDTDRAGALQAAERLLRMAREMQVPGPAGPIRLTVSIGAAVAEHAGEPLPALMQRVDAALYRAKESGRDRIEFAEPPAVPP